MCIRDSPYTTYTLADYRTADVQTDYVRRYITNGVYLYNYVYCFLQGLVRHATAWSSQMYDFTRREAIDPAVEFVHPEDLTERQLEILAGNEDSCAGWVQDPFTGQYECAETVVNTPSVEIAVNCAGTEYVIETGVNWDTAVMFYDYGIFTKPDTGVTDEGVIVPESVEPVYAFSVEIGGAEIVYGMVKDGQLFITERFAKAGAGEYTVPGVEDATNREGEPVTCTQYVRAGKSVERLRPDA
jgi:hypothetical protein